MYVCAIHVGTFTLCTKLYIMAIVFGVGKMAESRLIERFMPASQEAD